MTEVPEAATWLPVALALRLGSFALALAFAGRPALSRRAALAGSCLASARHRPARRPCAHDRPGHSRRVAPTRGFGFLPRLLRRPTLGVVPARSRAPGHPDRRLQRGLPRPRRARPTLGVRGRGLQRPGGRGRAGLRRQRRDRLPVRVGADDARERGARDDGARAARDAPRRLPVSGDVARRHRLPDRRVPHPGSGRILT